MRKLEDGRVLFTPRDLVEYMASPFASWMSRVVLDEPDRAGRDDRTAEDALLQEAGARHEQAYLENLRAQHLEVATIPPGPDPPARTLAAMAEGRQVIYQAALEDGTLSGRADFLLRQPGRSRFGDWRYGILDTKLAHSPRPDFLVQLCAYAEMLEAAQACALDEVTVVLGTGEEQAFRLADFLWFYRHLRADFLRFMTEFSPDTPPDPEPRADHGAWTSEAERFFADRDHLVLVAGIRRSQIRRLAAVGISTVRALADTQLDRVTGISTSAFHALREQARLQIASRRRDRPEFQVLEPALPDRPGLAALPPSSPMDVFFDMEGYPHEPGGGLEYLFGAVTVENGRAEFHDWWAHDRPEERRAFANFVAWARERRKRDPRMHIYHYAPYEVTALKKLMGRHGVCETEVDDLLRNQVFVDLYRVVRQGVRVGAAGYSLKDLESLYRSRRSGGVKSAGDSIVAYHGWRARNESRDWTSSQSLRMIRDYNRDDCESLAQFCSWLIERQANAGISWIPPRAGEAGQEIPANAERPDAVMARRLLQTIPVDPTERANDRERWRVQELLGHLCEFHRREDKVFWWSVFDRQAMTHEELADDLECLGDLRREAGRPVTIKKSLGFWYTFDPDQDTKLEASDICAFAHDWNIKVAVEELDRENGRALLKIGSAALSRLPDGEPPARVSLVPGTWINPDALVTAVLATAEDWLREQEVRPALDGFLRRSPPKIRGHAGGPIVQAGELASDAAVRIADALDESALVIQGPPGAGKTTTAAHMILKLIRDRKRRVAVAANSHAAILNLMRACAKESAWRLDCMKVGGDPNDELFRRCAGARRADGSEAMSQLGGTLLVGGTAFFFARQECDSQFDTLFVDEAGQVSLANLVAMSRATRNLVLMGDQRQLAQPIQGSHPGESGLSALDYYLQDHATIPEELGVFLGTTWRLHPTICTYVSESFYEGRLRADPSTANRVVRLPAGTSGLIRAESGIVFVPVEHDANTQSSEEEAAVVGQIVAELRGRELTDERGQPAGRLADADILVVAPYNAQVRLLQRTLGGAARVGSVDKFQGQEAAVVIVSMCASDPEALPRGLAFLLEPNRLNVALSRGRSLAIVVGSPALARARASSIDEMRLLNLYARLIVSGQPGKSDS